MDNDSVSTCSSESSDHFVTKGGFKKMYIAAAACLFGAAGMGAVGGYTAVGVPDMRKASSRISGYIDDDAVTWFGSFMALGALFGGLLAGPLCGAIGRKLTLILISVPFTVGWILICYSNNLVPLYTGRLLTGLCCGMMCVVAPTYLIEIATPDVRGLLGSSFQLSVTLGILMAGGLGAAIRWTWLAVVCAIPPIIMAAGMLPMPESPRWLVGKGRYDEALAALIFLHGETADAATEIQRIKSSIEEQPTGRITLEEVKKPTVWKSFLLSMGLMVFQQFCGVNAFLLYTVDIFNAAGSSLDPTLATILVDLAQVIFTVAAAILVDRAGRKILLLVSGGGTFLGLFVFATFEYIKSRNAESVVSFGWIPVLCLILFIAAFSLGYGPIAWLMIPEMVPVRVLGAVSGIATAFNWTCVFLVTKLFKVMDMKMHDYGVYWFYSAFCILSCFFVYFFLPETKGKSLDDVQRLFDKTLGPLPTNNKRHRRSEILYADEYI